MKISVYQLRKIIKEVIKEAKGDPSTRGYPAPIDADLSFKELKQAEGLYSTLEQQVSSMLADFSEEVRDKLGLLSAEDKKILDGIKKDYESRWKRVFQNTEKDYFGKIKTLLPNQKFPGTPAKVRRDEFDYRKATDYKSTEEILADLEKDKLY